MAGSITTWKKFNILLLFILFILLVEVFILADKNMMDVIMPWGVVVLVIFVLEMLLFTFKWSDKLSDNGWASISSVLLIIIMVISGFFAPKGINYIMVFVSMLLFFMVLGILINQRLPGILIDERNQMSLSRFQMVVWTAILLSAYLTIALSRIAANVPPAYALNIVMDWELWALLGTCTVSLVGAPLILSEKKNRAPSEDEQKSFNDVKAKDTTNMGLIPKNATPDMAEFADIFRGDETATYKNINMAKVQMFFFTIIVALAYGLMLYNSIVQTCLRGPYFEFPELHDSIIAILTISHAGYLTNKATDQTAVDKTT